MIRVTSIKLLYHIYISLISAALVAQQPMARDFVAAQKLRPSDSIWNGFVWCSQGGGAPHNVMWTLVYKASQL